MSSEKSLDRSVPAVRMRWPSGIAFGIGLSNLPFLGVLLLHGLLPSFLIVLLVGAILFLAPGLAWTDHRKGDAAIILFLGAEFTQVWVKSRGRRIEPEEGAVKIHSAAVNDPPHHTQRSGQEHGLPTPIH